MAAERFRMKFAFFDLDHTLLPVDTGDAWTRFAIARAGLGETALAQARDFNLGYKAGRFDASALTDFQMSLLRSADPATVTAWRDDFVAERVLGHIRPQALALVEEWRERGFTPVLATGTHAFVTAPIAKAFGIDELVAAEPERDAEGRFTGRLKGSHGYGEGKLTLAREFLRRRAPDVAGKDLAFFSDSINDLPFFDFVERAGGTVTAVHPDARLRVVAQERAWPVVELFEKEDAA